MSYEVSDFNKEVIEASFDQPVLVDFWAPWCGPCRALSPTLEKLANEAGETWKLATVNTDENPELSMSFQVRGIPAVKLFVDGKVAGEFTGAMPEHAVRQWLDQQIPSESDKSLATARDLLSAGHDAEAVAILEQLGDQPEAQLFLASTVVFSDPARAVDLAASASGASGSLEFLRNAVETVGKALLAEDALPDGPGRTDFQAALKHLRAGETKPAIESLMQVLLKDRYYGEDAARKLGVSVFTLLGDAHPVTKELRRTFDMYLY